MYHSIKMSFNLNLLGVVTCVSDQISDNCSESVKRIGAVSLASEPTVLKIFLYSTNHTQKMNKHAR